MFSFTALVFLLLGSSLASASSLGRRPHKAPLHDPISAVTGLVSRVLGPTYTTAFNFSVIPADESTGNDVFELGEGYPIVIRGNTGVALSSGLGWYMKYSLQCSWGWGVNNSGNSCLPPPPTSLPPPSTQGRFVSPARTRYSWNTCTFGYSFPWYDMQRWREEVDRIALWGINAPLLPIGLEAAEAAVYSSMGLTEAELTAWFTGHSHLPWQRMANIQVCSFYTLSKGWRDC